MSWYKDFAWTPGAGTYEFYPPYLNFKLHGEDCSASLTVRGHEKLVGDHYEMGPTNTIEIPPDVVAGFAQFFRVYAQAIEAATAGETAKHGSTEGESAVPTGCAQ